LNSCLQPLYKKAVSAIRTVDRNHIVLLGAPQWNTNFAPLTDWKFDDKIMYTCHKYGGEPTAEAIKDYISFRDKSGLPMYMGEIGHGTFEWQEAFCKVLEENNIGYTFWPYKKIEKECMVAIKVPENWDVVVKFAEGDRSDFGKIRENRPDQAVARKAMSDFLEMAKFQNCTPVTGYINSLLLKSK
jgi:endoglucanase